MYITRKRIACVHRRKECPSAVVLAAIYRSICIAIYISFFNKQTGENVRLKAPFQFEGLKKINP